MKLMLWLLAAFLVIETYANFASAEDELYLTPLIENGQIDEAKNLSQVVNLVSNDYVKRESYSGYLTVNKSCNSNLFFWFFKAVSEPTEPSNPLTTGEQYSRRIMYSLQLYFGSKDLLVKHLFSDCFSRMVLIFPFMAIPSREESMIGQQSST